MSKDLTCFHRCALDGRFHGVSMKNSLTLFSDDNFNKAVKISETLSKSNIIPSALRGKPADIFSILVLGGEMGVSPMQSLNSIDVIQGKPTMAPQLMLGLIRSRLPKAYIKIEIDEKNLIAKCTTARDRDHKDESYIATWDIAKASKMNLVGKDNYKKQPANMLKWRAVGESCRVTFPDILKGLYLPDEVEGIEEIISTKECIDADFPIPEEEKEIGPDYRVQNGMFRGKQLKDIETDELEMYAETLEKRFKKGVKPWENELYTVIVNYFNMIDGESEDAKAK